MDSLVAQAREAHRTSREHTRLSAHYRDVRDQLIRQAYESGEWSYSQLARQVGCTRELIAKIIQGRTQPGRCGHCGQQLGSSCPGCGRRRHDHTILKCYLC